VNCYHLGHPEPVTLPRFLPGLRTVTFKGGLSEQPLNDLAIWLARLRLTGTRAKKDVLGQIIKAALPFLSKLGAAEEPCSAVRVDVFGWSGGEYGEEAHGTAAHMTELTGLPLAIGARMLARGDVRMPGVVTPEACLDADLFLAEMEKRGVAVQDMTGQWPAAIAVPAQPPIAGWAVTALVVWLLYRWLCRR
jgi:lysine 6-dehydrogenase